MSKPIFELFVIKNNVANAMAQKSLSDADKKALFDKEAASRTAVNATFIAFCDSAWADEETPNWGLVRYPDLAARIKHTQSLRDIGWLDYYHAFSLLGTSDTEPTPVTIPNPIYKLWVVKSNPAAQLALANVSKADSDAVLEKHNAVYKETGSSILISCDSYWSNEAYSSFGVSIYPNIEANQKVTQTLTDLGWRKYFDSFTLLGTPITVT